MSNEVIEVGVKGLAPTANGVAVFLGDGTKCFVIYVDVHVGNSIQMTISGAKRERPLTHDLIGHILLGLGVSVERIVINDVRDGTYYARIILSMENELGRKIVEIDARPSDSIVLSLQQRRPIYVARAVFESVEDMTEILQRVIQQSEEQSGEGGGKKDE